MSRRLDDLCPKLVPKAEKLIARFAEAGIAVLIVDTLRTPEEQRANVAKGVSWTLNSKHLAQPSCCGKSHAIDLAPYEVYQLHGPDKLRWDASDPVWIKMGDIGTAIGLKWGVWKNGKQVDPGHFELRAT